MASLAPPRNGVNVSSSNGSSNGQSSKDLFNAALQSRVPTNNYITHLKIWETVSEENSQPAPPSATSQRKARYLILAVQRDTGRVTLNKAKRNANGTFSIGKDWDLNTLREIIVHEPTYFTLTLSRSYSWQTEKAKEQSLFLQSAVKIFRKYTGEDGPNCVGFDANGASGSTDSLSAPTPSSTLPRSSSPTSSKGSGPRPVAINTQIPLGVSRDSISSAGSKRGGQDGFYSPRDVPSPIRTAPGTTFQAGGDNVGYEDQSYRPPAMQRTASTGQQRLPTPDIQVQDVSESSIQEDGQRTGQGTSFQSADASLSAAMNKPPPLLARSLSRLNGSRTASPLNSEASQEASNQSETFSQVHSAAAAAAAATSDVSARRPSRGRRFSVENLGVASSGGDARARLSSIEPVRGGAAYEKMLLAGTGLTGVAEGDDEGEEDEDPYGGADIADVTAVEEQDDILPRTARKVPSKRRQGLAYSQDLRDAGEVGKISSELIEDDEEDTTLAAVEEMLEGFEWRHHSNGLASNRGGATLRYGAKGGKGPADMIEARLLDELAALDAANIHAIIESDDRVSLVVRHMEEALHQLDVIDSMVASYKMQLNARANDISHIESQNRGLQVQTSNQRALSNEIDKLLDTVQVDDSAVEALMDNEFASDDGISEVERAGAALYKAMLQARRSEDETRGGDSNATGMAAATERLEEYSNLADQFAMRLFDFLSQTFTGQTKAVLKDPARLNALSPPHPTIESHQAVEDFLGRYCGLLLYAKEVSPNYFQRISASYFANSSERYKSEIITLFSVWRSLIAPVSDEEISEASFQISGYTGSGSIATRSGTIRRAGRQNKSSRGSSEVTGFEAFNQILMTIIPLVAREQNFIADLLHINNNNVTFADYMSMEVYFRRRAAEVFSYNSPSGPLRDMKSALDLIFGFFALEIQTFADQVFAKDRVQLVGVLGALDRSLMEAEELNNEFLSRTLGKLHMRLASQLDKFINEQIRAIEQTKLTVKKRKGVTHFIKVFPNFVERVEVQLVNCETLNIRSAIDSYYEAICNTMFDALQAMAIPKVDGGMGSYNADEDKGLLNHHIILIENMYHFVKEVGRLKASIALGPLMKRAQNMLEDALSSYVQSALRRPLGKMMDFGDGIDALLRSTPPNEVSLHGAYNRQAAKRLVKDYSSKDIRKSVEALSKRVTKHFDEEEITSLAEGLNGISKFHDASGINAEEIVEVLGKVWRSLEDGFTMECDRLQRILRDCYSNSNDSSKLVCDFTMEDVRRPFASNSPAGKRR